jgi:quercetin dioxygenase-like cupin family protein
MAWFQSEATDPRSSSPIHGGVGEILIRQLFGGRMTMPIHVQVWELAAGTSEGDHTHRVDDPTDDWEELYYVLSGVGTITIDGTRHEIAAGEAVLVPAGVDHGLYATGTDALRILLIFGKSR